MSERKGHPFRITANKYKKYIIMLLTRRYCFVEICACFAIFRAKLRAALYNNEWIVDWAELKQHEEGGTGRSSMMLSAMSMNDGSDKRYQIVSTPSRTLIYHFLWREVHFNLFNLFD